MGLCVRPSVCLSLYYSSHIYLYICLSNQSLGPFTLQCRFYLCPPENIKCPPFSTPLHTLDPFWSRGQSRVGRVGTLGRRVWPPCRLATLTAGALTCHFNLTLLLYPGLLAPIPPGEEISRRMFSAPGRMGEGVQERRRGREIDVGCEKGRRRREESGVLCVCMCVCEVSLSS